jgi:hypothetical protein
MAIDIRFLHLEAGAGKEARHLFEIISGGEFRVGLAGRVIILGLLPEDALGQLLAGLDLFRLLRLGVIVVDEDRGELPSARIELPLDQLQAMVEGSLQRHSLHAGLFNPSFNTDGDAEFYRTWKPCPFR